MTIMTAMILAFRDQRPVVAGPARCRCEKTTSRTTMLKTCRRISCAAASGGWPIRSARSAEHRKIFSVSDRVLLLHRRRLYDHRHGDRVWQRLGLGYPGLVGGVTGDADRRVSQRAGLRLRWPARSTTPADPALHFSRIPASRSFAIQLDKQWEFWVLAVCVGFVSRAASRRCPVPIFAQIIPPENAGEFFGLFDICGKGAAFLGTAFGQSDGAALRQRQRRDCDSGGDVCHRPVFVQPRLRVE